MAGRQNRAKYEQGVASRTLVSPQDRSRQDRIRRRGVHAPDYWQGVKRWAMLRVIAKATIFAKIIPKHVRFCTGRSIPHEAAQPGRAMPTRWLQSLVT